MRILPLSYISEAANLLWQPEGSPGVMSHQSSHLLPSCGASSPPSRPWPPCCDTLPPSTCTTCCACPRSYVLADDSLCRLLPTCQPWKNDARPLHRGGGSARKAAQPSSASSFSHARPLQQLPHERKNRAGAQSHNRVVPGPERTRKESPAPLWSLSPPAYSRLAPFGE